LFLVLVFRLLPDPTTITTTSVGCGLGGTYIWKRAVCAEEEEVETRNGWWSRLVEDAVGRGALMLPYWSPNPHISIYANSLFHFATHTAARK
jgi:hypothetical protein